MQLPGPHVWGPPRDREAALTVLRRAIELGVNHIDTAQYYGPDVSNELIHTALHPYPDDLVLVSKVGAVRDNAGGWIPAQSPAELRAGVEDNLRSLQIEQLGAVNLRLLDGDESDAEADAAPDLPAQLAEMAALRDEGKICGVGISTANLHQVRAAHEVVGLTCVQNAFSLVDQKDQEVLDYCVAHDIAYVPYFPLGSAFPDMPRVTDQPPVRAVADRIGATPAQVGLAWLLAQAPNVLVIPGTSSVDHLEENLRCADISLSAADLAELDTVTT